MVQLECGCEVSDDKIRVLSLCSLHAVHEHMRLQVMQNHPRAREQVVVQDKDYERALVLAIAPVAISRVPPGKSDPNTTAESIFQHVREIMRRLE